MVQTNLPVGTGSRASLGDVRVEHVTLKLGSHGGVHVGLRVLEGVNQSAAHVLWLAWRIQGLDQALILKKKERVKEN